MRPAGVRRYKLPNNGVLPGPDGSCWAGKTGDQQVFTREESEWNRQFTLSRRRES